MESSTQHCKPLRFLLNPDEDTGWWFAPKYARNYFSVAVAENSDADPKYAMYWSVRILVCALPMKSIERFHRPLLSQMNSWRTQSVHGVSCRTYSILCSYRPAAAVPAWIPGLSGLKHTCDPDVFPGYVGSVASRFTFV